MYRLYSNETGKAEADLITVYDEKIDENEPIEIFDPDYTWKRKTLENVAVRPLLVDIFKNGELVYDVPSLDDVRTYCASEVATMWDEVRRFDNPHNYYVDLSQKLWDIKQSLISKSR